MTPFYHPTSVLVLDDDPLFLESLDFQFSEEVSCQTFTRPDAALEHLRAQSSQHPNFARYFRDVSEMNLPSETRFGDRLLNLQVAELQAVVDDISRHQRVSVAIVDYDMPKMTGVEFCRAIRSLPVKTILLTGKAGLETAISAFNEGVIDCFLQKQDPSVTFALRREITRLQREYFEAVSDPITRALDLRKPCFFTDPNFITLCREMADKHEIVEHHISVAPPGLKMRDADGKELFLLMSDDQLATAQREAAEAAGAPSELLHLLRSRKMHAWFPTSDGRYESDYALSWPQFIWPAHPLPGSDVWHFSLVHGQRPSEEAREYRRA